MTPSTSQRLGESAGVFLVVALAYTMLLSDIGVDDAPRYVFELGTNRYHWDLGHLWMQPLALLVYRAIGRFVGALATLEGINIAAMALGCAILFETLRAAGHGRARGMLGAAFVALSFNLMSLAPTAHIKLMVFPALALSMRHAVLWELAFAEQRPLALHGLAAGLWLGVGTNLLVSVLPSAVFVSVFMFWRARRAGRRWLQAMASALPFVAGVAASGGALLLLAYAIATASGTTTAPGIGAFLFGGMREKQGLHVGFASWREVPFRFVFSLLYNFVFLPQLGSLGRAWLWGLLPDQGVHMAALAGQALVALLSLLALGATLVVALKSASNPARASLLALGYVLGAAAFSLYYNLNDPEHWFQFTLPVAFLAVQARRRWLDVLVLGVWLPVFATLNLWTYGVPRATFVLEARQQALRAALGPEGLYVGFGAYPGEPDSSLVPLGDIEIFKIDLELSGAAGGDVPRVLEQLDRRIDAALARGGRVIVFRALDPQDWRGPVMQLALAGLTRSRLQQHLSRRYRISGPIDVAGFPGWEIANTPPR